MAVHKEIEDFMYCVRSHNRVISSILVRERNVPSVKKDEAFNQVTFSGINGRVTTSNILPKTRKSPMF